MSTAVSLKNMVFSWGEGPPILDVASFEIAFGERVFLRGASGSGKSTLLGLLAGVLSPQSGDLQILGQDMTSLSAGARDRLRAEKLGVIFQMFNLLPFLDVVQNVTLAYTFSRQRRRGLESSPDEEAKRLLGRLGLSDASLLDRKVGDLSVGQQQRVAVARALLGEPELVLADEPTSALDTDARDEFIRLLSEETSRSGAALVFVSHDRSLAHHFDRSVDLEDLNGAGL